MRVYSFIIFLLHKYVIRKYPPYISTIIILVNITDFNKPLFPNISRIFKAKRIPNIECIIASNNGVIKKINISLNNDFRINLSSAPMRLKMIYLLRLSLASLKFFNASIAALDIKKTTPKYIPRKVTITPNDLVIISATPIPGNEKFVSKVIDDLMQIGAEVVYSALEAVHVSGHACQEEQKLIIALAKPKYFIPVHGEYRQLISHSETAQSMGIDKDNIVLLQNGRVLEIDENGIGYNGSVPSGRVLVDGLGVGDVGNIVLRDRQHLSQDGLIVIVLTMDSATGEVIAGPDIISRGFVYVRESEGLMEDARHVLEEAVGNYLGRQKNADWSKIKLVVRDTMNEFIWKRTKRRPMILPIIMDV